LISSGAVRSKYREETAMTDRENSPAYAALPPSARRALAAIERAIGDGSSASVPSLPLMPWQDDGR
jgi:hypothetical protein